MQGGHQVAQKFRTSTLPPNDTGETAAPESALIVKSGAGPPSFADVSRRLNAMTPTKLEIRRTSRIRSAELIVKGRLMGRNFPPCNVGTLHISEYRIRLTKHP